MNVIQRCANLECRRDLALDDQFGLLRAQLQRVDGQAGRKVYSRRRQQVRILTMIVEQRAGDGNFARVQIQISLRRQTRRSAIQTRNLQTCLEPE